MNLKSAQVKIESNEYLLKGLKKDRKIAKKMKIT